MNTAQPTGTFITFEGVEGCGKTTQIRLLQRHLDSLGYAVDVTREPGGTPIAEAIRGVLLDPANDAMTPETELLLYAAARAQHVTERILPALEAGRIVLCDRFADSTRAYQCGARGLDREVARQANQAATRGLRPLLTVLIDVPVEVGLARAANARAADRIERESPTFHTRVRNEFLLLAREEPDRVKVVDGTRSAAEVTAEICDLVEPLLRTP